MEEFTWISAFFLGLMGAPHCAGMCGGIVAALSLGSQPNIDAKAHGLLQVLAYNLGRISSYIIAGMLVGGLSALATNMVALHHAQLVLKLLAALFMLFLGLYLGGWWPVLTHLERWGASVWRYLEPFGRRFIPIRDLHSAWLVGAVWGWLPCGLVYTALIYSATAGGAGQGGLLMLFFGLGTMPAMLLMGAAGSHLRSLLQQPWVRRLSGVLVISFAGYLILSIFMH